MSLLARAERKFGRFAIPGLIRLVVGVTVAAYVLSIFYPESMAFWELDPAKVRHGEVWRLISYIFVPSFGGPLGMLCYVIMQFWIGDGLERVWGAFRLNVYFFLGMLGAILGAFFFDSPFSNALIFSSLFFAFARYFGDMVIHLFFILPVKVKWLAWINAALLMLSFLFGDWQGRGSILLGLTGYFVFFGKEIVQDARFRHATHARRVKFQADLNAGAGETMHQCKTCGCTEVSHPDAHFRVNAEGDEYCLEHLPMRPRQ